MRLIIFCVLFHFLRPKNLENYRASGSRYCRKFRFKSEFVTNPFLFSEVFEEADLFRVSLPPPPSAKWAHIICTPPNARAIFLHDDLHCNGMCSVTGGRITCWGDKRKRSEETYDKKSVFSKNE